MSSHTASPRIGFVDRLDDPGGMTNLGVTKTVYDDFYGNLEVSINLIFDA